MDTFKLTTSGSMRSMFFSLEDQFHEMKNVVRRHFERWSAISREYSQQFELEADQLSAKGEMLGKSFALRAEFTAVDQVVFAEIKLIGDDELSGKPVIIDSYYLNRLTEILASTTKEAIPFRESVVNEHQAICEAFYRVAEHRGIK